MNDIVTMLEHTYHVRDLPDGNPIRRAIAEILRLREEAERMRQIAVEARRDADASRGTLARLASEMERWHGDERDARDVSEFNAGRLAGLHDAATWVRAQGGAK